MAIGGITRCIAGGEKIRKGRPEFCHADLTDDSAFAAWITLHHNDIGFQRGAIVFLGPENICDTCRNEVIAGVLRIALQKCRVRLLSGLEMARHPLLFSLLQQLGGCQACTWWQQRRLGCGACCLWKGSRSSRLGVLVCHARRGAHCALSLCPRTLFLHLSVVTPSNIYDHTRWRMQPLCMPHDARLFQYDVSHDSGGVCTPPYLLNEPSTSTRYL